MIRPYTGVVPTLSPVPPSEPSTLSPDLPSLSSTVVAHVHTAPITPKISDKLPHKLAFELLVCIIFIVYFSFCFFVIMLM